MKKLITSGSQLTAGKEVKENADEARSGRCSGVICGLRGRGDSLRTKDPERALPPAPAPKAFERGPGGTAPSPPWGRGRARAGCQKQACA